MASQPIKDVSELLSSVGIYRKSVLIIDSEELGSLKDALLSSYFSVTHARVVGDLNAILSGTSYDLVILNTNIPDADGLNVLRWLAAEDHSHGILVLTNISNEIDRIVALEIGADDIVDQSCSSRELIARARAILRRCSNERSRTDAVQVLDTRELPLKGFKFLGWVLDCQRTMLFSPDGLRVDITWFEYQILKLLLSEPGIVKGRSELLGLRNEDSEVEHPRTVDVVVARLRKKFSQRGSDNIIETVRGGGYRSVSHVELI
jgi:DNA-binding response OmpR family regulator